jgi:hypothetical protein
MLKHPITHEEAEKFLNDHTPEKRPRNTRIITVTISGPDAIQIAAGVTSGMARIAQSIEERHRNTSVRVSVTPIDSAPADTTAKATT